MPAAGDPSGKAATHLMRSGSKAFDNVWRSLRDVFRLEITMSGAREHLWKIRLCWSEIALSSKTWAGLTALAAAKCSYKFAGSPGINDGMAFPLGWMPVAAVLIAPLSKRFLDGWKFGPMHSCEVPASTAFCVNMY